MGDDKDGSAGSFLPLEFPGYHNYFGGGKPPPPTVTPKQHSGALACTGQEAPCHRPVHQGGRKEAQKAGGGGATREFGKVLPGLRRTAGNIHLVQVSGTRYDGGRQRLAVGVRQPEEGEKDLDADGKDHGMRGGGQGGTED